MSAGDAKFGLEISKGVMAKFTMAAIGFVGSIIFARILGPSGYGTFYIVTTLVNVLDNPVTGWANACAKRIAQADFPTAEALGSGLAGATVLPIIIIPLVYLFQRFTNIYDLPGLVVPFSILFISICFFAVSNRILSARHNFSAANWADTLRSLLTTPIQLGLVLMGIGVSGMIYGLAVATVLTVPYVLYKIDVKPVRPSWNSLASIASYAKYSVPTGFVGSAKSHIDILLLGAVLSSTAVGKYQVSLQLTMAGTFIGGVGSAGLMARVSNNWSKDDQTAIINDVINSLGFASLLAIPILFGSIAMPADLLGTVFGPEYADAGLVLIGLSMYTVLQMQSTQLTSTISGIDRPDINTKVETVSLVLNIIFGYVLLLEYGIIGVVIATVLSEIARYVVLSYIIKQYFPEITLVASPLRDQLFSGISMFIIIDYVHNMVAVTWWGDLAVLISLGAVIYFGTLVSISKPFRVTVRGVLFDANIRNH